MIYLFQFELVSIMAKLLLATRIQLVWCKTGWLKNL